MKNHVLPTLLVTMSFVVAANAAAAPFLSFDPRTLGMGGAGVAAGTSANAALNNPALLAAARDGEDFSLELPMAGAGVADPDKLFAALTDFNDNNYVLNFGNALAAFNKEFETQKQTFTYDGARLEAVRQDVVRSGREMLAGLQRLSDKTVQGHGNVSAVMGIPSKSFGVSLFGNVWAAGGAHAVMSDYDVAQSNQVLNDIEAMNFNDPMSVVLNYTPIVDPSDTFTSYAEGRFALFGETGIAIATKASLLSGMAVGITPKYVQVRTYDFKYVARELSSGRQFSLKEGETIHNSVNFDAGIARDFHNGWKTGLVVKNVVPQSYKTALGNHIKVNPQARLGVANQLKRWATISADLDITGNPSVDFEGKSRYLGVGAELDAWRWAQLRMGYRRDVIGGSGVYAMGLGLSPFGLHIDAGVAAGRQEIAASVQTGFRF